MTKEIKAIDCFVNTSALLKKDVYAGTLGYLFKKSRTSPLKMMKYGKNFSKGTR
jgi:hypothetical protein